MVRAVSSQLQGASDAEGGGGGIGQGAVFVDDAGRDDMVDRPAGARVE